MNIKDSLIMFAALLEANPVSFDEGDFEAVVFELAGGHPAYEAAQVICAQPVEFFEHGYPDFTPTFTADLVAWARARAEASTVEFGTKITIGHMTFTVSRVDGPIITATRPNGRVFIITEEQAGLRIVGSSPRRAF